MSEKPINAIPELYLAYQAFAEAGDAGLKSFRHIWGADIHFSDQASLQGILLQEHRRVTARLCRNLEGCESYIPDIFEVLSRFPTEIRFHRRLLLRQRDEQATALYRELNRRTHAIIYPLWVEYVHYTGESTHGKNLHLSLMDLWLLHLNPFNLSARELIENAEHINRWLMCFREGDSAWKRYSST